MTTRQQLGVLLIGSLAVGCAHGGGPGGSDGPRAVRPGWIPSPNRSHPDRLYVTGTCRDQADMASARACAVRDAARQVAAELGSSQPVEVKGAYIEDEHSERRQTAAGLARDYWVLVAYPRKAIAQAETRLANRVLLGVSCSSEPPGGCDASFASRVEQGITRGKLALAPKHLDPSQVGELDGVLKEAARQRAASVLLATISGRFLSAMEGEFYAEARCGYRFVDAVSGKVLATFDSGPVKGGHIGKAQAVRKALDLCVEKLSSRAAAGLR